MSVDDRQLAELSIDLEPSHQWATRSDGKSDQSIDTEPRSGQPKEQIYPPTPNGHDLEITLERGAPEANQMLTTDQ